MTRASSFELFSIFLVGLLCYLVNFTWPDSISIGRFVLSMALIFLIQTLLRDLWILSRQRSGTGGKSTRAISAFCVESAVGLSAVAVGCGLLFAPLPTTLNLGNPGWSISILLTMLLCFVLRDFVFQWNPWRVYKDPGHVNIVVRW